MSRIIGIDGDLNGHSFKVKPKSPKAFIVQKELQQEMDEWQKKNNKEVQDYREKHKKEIEKALEEDNYAAPVFLNAPENKEWILDEEFRAKRFSKMAHTCMEFDEKPPAKLWKSDELETSTIEEAWDFFMGTKRIPNNGISSR